MYYYISDGVHEKILAGKLMYVWLLSGNSAYSSWRQLEIEKAKGFGRLRSERQAIMARVEAMDIFRERLFLWLWGMKWCRYFLCDGGIDRNRYYWAGDRMADVSIVLDWYVRGTDGGVELTNREMCTLCFLLAVCQYGVDDVSMRNHFKSLGA